MPFLKFYMVYPDLVFRRIGGLAADPCDDVEPRPRGRLFAPPGPWTTSAELHRAYLMDGRP